MGKKKKKDKRLRKNDRVTLQNQSASQLIQQASDFLQAGKARQALPLLKAALKSAENTGAVRGLLLQAYLARSDQLWEKGMTTEAAVMRQHALANLPDASGVNESDLIRLLDAADVDAAVEICRRHFQTNAPSARLLQKLAGLLVITQRWGLLDRMPGTPALIVDAPAARQAADRMHAGDWESALEAMQPVRRTSPYAAVRIFCRAMTCFYADDDAGLHRACDIIPQDSPFHPVSQALTRDARQIVSLWDRQPCTETDVVALLAHIEHNRIRPAAMVIVAMARAVAPQDPDRAAFDILMTLWPLTLNGQLPPDALRRLVKSVLPGRWTKLVLAKFAYYHFEDSILDTGRYLGELGTEFPDEHRRLKAASLLLVHTVERLKTGGIFFPPIFMLPRPYRQTMGLASTDPEVNLSEMLTKAIELDPANRRAYELLAQTPRYAREAKTLVEAGLEKMMSVFPEDPFSCLELATLYYEKNAYRKAETALLEAKRRAPQDVRVTDRHVLALLISSEKRIKIGKLHLAADDLEKAQDLSTDRTLPLVTAKTIRFKAENTGQLTLFSGTAGLNPAQWLAAAQEAVGRLMPFQRLTTLGLLAIDLTRGKGKKHTAYRKPLNRLFKLYRKDIDGLTRAELRDLLLPMEKELWPVMPTLQRAGVYLEQYPGLLPRINDADIAPVIEAMVAEELLAPAKAEVQRRLKQPDAPFKSVLNFYLVVIKHLDGELVTDGRAFEMAISAAGNQKESLRAASRRLAMYAPGRLAEALREFNFNFLQHPLPPIGDVSGPFWGADEEEDDLENGQEFGAQMIPLLLDLTMNEQDILTPEIIEKEIGPMIAAMEKLIDEMGMRGLPGPVIRQARDEMKRGFSGLWMFDILTKLLRAEQVEDLSREAWEFLFGK